MIAGEKAHLKNGRRKTLRAAALFALHFFAFLLTELTVNERAGALLGARAVVPVYALGILCTGLGYLLYALICRLAASGRARRAVCHALLAAFAPAAAVMLFTESAAIFVAAALSALAMFGCAGGMVYHRLSLELSGSPRTGLVIGASGAAAIAVQYTVQNLLPVRGVYMAALALSAAGIIALSLGESASGAGSAGLRAANSKGGKGAALIAAVALMSVVVTLNDGVLVPLDASREINLASALRLFYALGLVTAGLAADIRKRGYMALFTSAAMFISSVAVLFLSSPSTYAVNAALFYFYCGFYVVFLSVAFLDLAPQTKNPALWAGMGRLTRSLTVAAAALPSGALFGRLGETGVAVISSALSIATLILLAVTGLLMPERRTGTLPADERVRAYALAHSFTPRETEIFERLVDGDGSVGRIAAELYVSPQAVYRHIASLCEKANVGTRVELMKDYFSGAQS